MKYLTFEKKYFKKKIKNQIYFKDWCLPDGIKYEQINKLSEKKYFNYKFSNPSQIIKNNKFIFKFINKIFPGLTNKMNNYHGVNYNEKYWKIILFPWLLPFISFMHERWHMMNSIKNNKNFIFCIYTINDTKFIIDNYLDFGENANQKLFNYWTLSKIVRFKKKIKFIEKKIQNTTGYQKEKIKFQNNTNYKKKIYIFFFTVLSKIFKIRFFLKNLGISKYKIILLNFKLKQFPFFWLSPEYERANVELEKRKYFFYKESLKKNFNNFINEIIHVCIPKNYLENYKNIKSSINKSYWPKSIRATLSAYDFTYNDVYKIWAAERSLNKKTKYLILQHGGNSGLAESAPGTDLHSLLADKYLTWGWKGKYKNNIPFHSVSLSNRSLNLKKNKKKIYFFFSIYAMFTYRYESLPRSNAEKIKKSNSIFQIINNINNTYTKDIVLRYLKSAEKRNFKRINKNKINKKISYDDASVPFLQILPEAKIIIHDSNNTGFLECLFFNVPTILILDKKLERFEKKSRKYLNLMKRKKIIHYDHKTATDFLNKNLHNIEKWWHDKKLQSIRKKFCNIYIKRSNDSLDDLSRFLERTVA
jgi:putative transferase (TIGR04331 family)